MSQAPLMLPACVLLTLNLGHKEINLKYNENIMRRSESRTQCQARCKTNFLQKIIQPRSRHRFLESYSEKGKENDCR